MSIQRKPEPESRPIIAILDDDAGFRATAAILLSDDFETAPFATAGELFRFLEDREPDLLLLDIDLGEAAPDGFAVLEAVRGRGLRFPVIVLTILAGLEVTARSIRMGVPFLQKDRELDADRFRQQIRLVLRASQMDEEIEYHRGPSSRGGWEDVFPWPLDGWGAALRRQVEPFLGSSQPILLKGERGTGKQTLARWVHRNSPRAEGPFLVFSPLGQTEDAVVRELFGSTEEGRQAVPGILAAAAPGTLFLEDLHLLPDATHHRLIRAIDEGAYTPVGSRRHRRLTCRVIASRIDGGLGGGDFGEAADLFWKAYQVCLSPPRERPNDLQFHLDRLAQELASAGAPVQPVPVEALVGVTCPAISSISRERCCEASPFLTMQTAHRCRSSRGSGSNSPSGHCAKHTRRCWCATCAGSKGFTGGMWTSGACTSGMSVRRSTASSRSWMMRRDMRSGRRSAILPAAAVTACLFAISHAAPAAAQPYTTLLPRSASDWVAVEQTPGVTWSVTVNGQSKGSANPRWEFHADAQEGIIGPTLDLRLNLSEFGIAPLTPEEAEYWAWHWFVRNMKTADMVSLSLIDEHGRRMGMATSHALYDYDRDDFVPPTKFKEDHNTLTEMLSFYSEGWGDLDPPLGRIVAVGLTMEMPHQQEVWLGPISFSRDRGNAVSPGPRAGREITSPGRALFVDLDGDGRVEAVAPWMDGDKIWRFDPRSGEFRAGARRDALATCGPLSQVAAADLDGDGDLDLVGVGSNQTALYTFTNRSGGFTATRRTIALPSRAAMVTSLALADDDRDGQVDLFIGYHLVAERLTDTGRIFRCPGLGGGRFGERRDLPTTYSSSHPGTYYVALVDLDGDGTLDLVSAAGILGVHVFRGLGGGDTGKLYVSSTSSRTDSSGTSCSMMSTETASSISTWPCSAFRDRRSGPARTTSCSTTGAFTSGMCPCPATSPAATPRRMSVRGAGRPPGQEIAVLEVDRLDVFDFARWRDAGAAIDRAVPRTELLTDPDIVSGAERNHLTDLDGDGVVEAVLSRETGFDVVPLPGTGPVRTVSISGFGEFRVSAGGCRQRAWSTRGPVEQPNGAWAVAGGGGRAGQLHSGGHGGTTSASNRDRGRSRESWCDRHRPPRRVCLARGGAPRVMGAPLLHSEEPKRTSRTGARRHRAARSAADQAARAQLAPPP